MLRPGNAGSNTAADQLAVVDDALAQLPGGPQSEGPAEGVAMLLRADSAWATHDVVGGLRARGIEFSIGFPLTEEVRHAVLHLPERAWKTSIGQNGDGKQGAEVAEITGLIDLSSWPEATRAICRRGPGQPKQ